MTWRLLEKNEREKFAEENKALMKRYAKEIRNRSADYCPYADILKAWRKNFKKEVTDIVPVVGNGEFGETLTDVVYMIRTKDGECALEFANRSRMSGEEYSKMRIEQALVFIEKEVKKNARND